MAERIDYTSKDYEGYREDMVELIPKKMPEWTDRSDNDPGIVILELIAHQLDKQSYYNDRTANEVFLGTATQRKSVISHCKLIDYSLSWHTSAKHWQVFEFTPQPEDIIIPKGSLVGTVSSSVEESVIFELLEDLIIPAGATGLEQDLEGNYLYKVEVEQGQTIFDEYLGSMEANISSFPILYSPVLKETISVYVENSSSKRKWEKVDDFISSIQTDEHFMVEMDEYDRVRVFFGNGVSGIRPEVNSNIYADYKIGGGAIGNVGANTITEFYEATAGFIKTFNPYGPHVLGKDKESIEDAKWKGPASLRTLNRYVVIPDFEEGVKLDFAGISKVKGFNVAGNIDLYVVPEEGDFLSQVQKDALMELIDSKKVIFTIVTLKDPAYVEINVEVNILAYDNYDSETIKYSAENIIKELFHSARDFGREITIADIHHALLLNVPGVRNPIVTAPVVDVDIQPTEIIKLGTLTVLVNGK